MRRKFIKTLVRRVDQMEGSLIVRGRRRLTKTINETIKKDLNLYGLSEDMVYIFMIRQNGII